MKKSLKDEIRSEFITIKKSVKTTFTPSEVRNLLSLSSQYKNVIKDKMKDEEKINILLDIALQCSAYQERAVVIDTTLRRLKAKAEKLNSLLKREFNNDESFVKLKKKDQTAMLDSELGPYLDLETGIKRKVEIIERVVEHLKETGYTLRTVVSALKVNHERERRPN